MKRIALVFTVLAMTSFAIAEGPSRLEITPTTFDFGWAPDNAKISAQFSVRNVSSEMIPIMSVQPTCGCTASQFSPATLGSQEETKIGLTFNTRGYANMPFNKPTKVKADVMTGEFSVNLKGHVLDAQAKVRPVGDGIVGFDADSKDKRKSIKIENKSDKDVQLNVYQPAAAWVKIKLSSDVIPAGKSVDMTVALESSPEDTRDTSITFTPMADVPLNNLTIAIRSGQAPTAYRPYNPPKMQPQPTPATQKK